MQEDITAPIIKNLLAGNSSVEDAITLIVAVEQLIKLVIEIDLRIENIENFLVIEPIDVITKEQ